MTDTTNPQHRAAFLNGLRALADFLATHSELPVPKYDGDVTVYADGTDDAKRAEVDRIARCLDVPPGHHQGLYKAMRKFGPVVYQAVVLPEASLAATRALMSYSGAVEPEEP
jgi:hypothetical protein